MIQTYSLIFQLNGKADQTFYFNPPIELGCQYEAAVVSYVLAPENDYLITCNIVQNSYMDAEKSDIILLAGNRTIPTYLPVFVKTLTSINLKIKNLDGRVIDLQKDKLAVVHLHLRPVHHC